MVEPLTLAAPDPMHFGRAATRGTLNDDALTVLRPHQHRARHQVQKTAHRRRRGLAMTP
jgi:hypothetical protein